MGKIDRLDGEWRKIRRVIESYQGRIDPFYPTPPEEFRRRQRLVQAALEEPGHGKKAS